MYSVAGGRDALGQRALGRFDDEHVLEPGQLGAHLQDAVEEAGVLHDDDGHAGVVGQVLRAPRGTMSCRR